MMLPGPTGVSKRLPSIVLTSVAMLVGTAAIKAAFLMRQMSLRRSWWLERPAGFLVALSNPAFDEALRANQGRNLTQPFGDGAWSRSILSAG